MRQEAHSAVSSLSLMWPKVANKTPATMSPSSSSNNCIAAATVAPVADVAPADVAAAGR